MKKNVMTTLMEKAAKAQTHAHAPYSGFQVGAAVMSSSGEVYAGCNVENAAYPLGQCAEATAIGTMVANGESVLNGIVIVSPNDDFCFPCGGCRQKIAEFADDAVPVVMATADGSTFETTVGELLPHAFRYTHPKKKAG